MAITWGPAVADATNAFRIGYEITQSPATVTNGTATVTVTLSIYLGTQYFADDSSVSWTITGDIAASGSIAFDHNSSTSWSSSNVTLLATRTKTVTTSFTGPVVTNGSATVTGLAAIAGTASVNWSKTTAQRPVGVPAAPVMSSTTGATRVSDTQQNLAWTNTSPTSASNPYVNVVVQRSTDGGAWVSIATLGVVSSYSDKTTSANHRYAYRVIAKNGAGSSAASGSSNTLKTTPAAPGKPTATKGSTDIALAWVNPTWQADNIEVWHAANGVWDGTALATLAATATGYTHPAPNAAQTHQYRLRSKTTTPTLVSAYSTPSDVVALQAPPNAPTNLDPSSVARDLAGAVGLSWRHNPVDTTAQTKFEVQHRVVGGPTWTSSGQIASGTSFYSLPAGTYANGQTVEWQVRTWGQHATASPWSTSAQIIGSSTPVATITTPGTTFNSSKLTAAWTYFDAEGTAQSAWEATLWRTVAGEDIHVETRSGTGPDTSVAFNARILDQLSYRLDVRVKDGAGLWSAWDGQPFTVTYSTPEVPVVTLGWDDEADAATVNIANPPTTVGHVDAVNNQLWRSIDDGPWVLVAEDLPTNANVVDPIPSLSGMNTYRVTAVSTLPSSVDSALTSISNEGRGGAVVVNAGEGFGEYVRLRSNIAGDLDGELEKVLTTYSGRTKPVEDTGIATSRKVQLKGTLADALGDVTFEELWELHRLPAPACYRDPDGRRWFVSTGPVAVAEPGKRDSSFSWTLTEVDYDEPTEANA